MAAQVVKLCDSIVAHIKQKQTDGFFSNTFNIARRNYQVTQLADTNVTNVWVYPQVNRAEPGTREIWSRTYSIALHLANFLDSMTQDEIDIALNLMDELELSVENTRFGEFAMISFETQTGRPFFEREATVDQNYFHAVSTVNYLGTL